MSKSIIALFALVCFGIIILNSCSDDDISIITGEGVFITPSGTATIEGELFLPEGEGPFPLLILVVGSGNETREGSEEVVDVINEMGYGFYIYDKKNKQHVHNWS